MTAPPSAPPSRVGKTAPAADHSPTDHSQADRSPADRSRADRSPANHSPADRSPADRIQGTQPAAGRFPLRRRPGPAHLTLKRLPRGTPLGRRAGLIGIGLLFAGFNTGNNLFYLIFTVMAASELVGFLVAGRVLRRLRVEVAAPRRGRARSPMRITICVENGSRWIPAQALKWKVGTGSGLEAIICTPALAPGARAGGTGMIVPKRRGMLRIESLEAESDFPLGLARRTARLVGLEIESLVTPRLDRARAGVAGLRRGDVRQLAHPKGFGEEPLDAREYQPGDDARRIDWKATARTERLMWRDRRGEPPRAIRVVLDRSGRPGDLFERRVSRAAGTAVAALSAGRPVGFTSGELELLPRSGPAQRRRILDYLALVQPSGASDGPGGSR